MGAWLLLLLCVPISSAESPTAHAEFVASTGHVADSVQAYSDDGTGVRVLPGRGNHSWSLDAASLAVHWTREKYVEQGHPQNFSERYGTYRIENSSGENTFNQATANSTSSSPNSTLAAVTSEDHVKIAAVASPFTVQPAQGSRWRVSNLSHTSVIDAPLASALIQASFGGGSLSIRGNFSLYVDNAIVTVRSGSGNSSFVSGSWRENLTPYPPGRDPPVRYVYVQRIRVDVVEGEFELSLADKGAEIVSGNIDFRETSETKFTRARGKVTSAQQVKEIDEPLLAIRNVTSLSAQNASLAEGLMRVRLNAPPAEFGFVSSQTGPPPHVGRVAPPSAFGPPAKLAAGLLTLGAAGSALVALRARRVVRIDDIELALLVGKPTKASRLAKSFLRKQPGDTDVVFLYAASFMANGRPDRLLFVIEPLATAMKVGARRSVALMLALAARAVGDPAKAKRWALEAARDPLLRAELKLRGEWPGTSDSRLSSAADRMPYHH